MSESFSVYCNDDNSIETIEHIRNGKVRVDFVNLGEGYFGDYDPDDPEDVNLLRFDVYRYNSNNDSWLEVDDSSYCTNVPATMDAFEASKVLSIIMREVYETVISGHPIKKLCERLSWIDENGSY